MLRNHLSYQEDPFSVQFSFSHSVVSDSLWPHGLQHARLPCVSPTPGACSNSVSIKSVMPSNHLILCPPRLLLPSIFPSIRVFSNESVLCIRWPKYWSFSFSISPSNEYSGLISFRIDWFDLAIQRTLKSLLQHHSSKASVLRCSAFFIVQLSHPYRTTGKPKTLTRWTFVGKVMSLLFSMLSRLVIAFLPRRPILGKNIYGSWGSGMANDPFKAFCFFLHLGKASRYQEALYPSLKLFSWFTVFVKSSQAPRFEGINSSYVTTGKTIGLTIWTFVGKIIFLLFNILSRFVSYYYYNSHQVGNKVLDVEWKGRLEAKDIVETEFTCFLIKCDGWETGQCQEWRSILRPPRLAVW